MKKLSKKKQYFKSLAIEAFDLAPWIDSLPFKLTKDQMAALADIRDDIKKEISARRIIMGDVGSGKSIIIFASALMVYPGVAILMAPTALLAAQLYEEARKFLPSFCKIILVKKGSKKLDFKGVNFIIGTHALLHQDLPSSSLIMIDEQHRFGSNQRKKIDELTRGGGIRAHFLQFSATPIPRSLSLIESNLVNFSFLKEIPFKKNIHTIILQNDGFKELLEHIKNQISQNKQIIIVYSLAGESESRNYMSLEEASLFWKQRFSNVYITHGKDKQKEEIMQKFALDGNILLSTTIVEVGISLPRLSTIVIVGAEHYGLATLHQLRGRVGRNGGEAWCYIYTKLKSPPSRLREFAENIDGFLVAKLDLKNRQGGDILNGAFQHGIVFNYYDMEEEIAAAARQKIKELNFLNDPPNEPPNEPPLNSLPRPK